MACAAPAPGRNGRVCRLVSKVDPGQIAQASALRQRSACLDERYLLETAEHGESTPGKMAKSSRARSSGEDESERQNWTPAELMLVPGGGFLPMNRERGEPEGCATKLRQEGLEACAFVGNQTKLASLHAASYNCAQIGAARSGLTRPASSCKALHEGTERCLRAFSAFLIESFKKRERDRRKREKRRDKAERRLERADLKQRREAEALRPSSASAAELPQGLGGAAAPEVGGAT